ncbi:hypothetical protein [Streptomyces sp. NPDC002573]|uniref:hypothetical protein n=1 Tax=Streptomyces sp. NPDC002573 TaxID=3364651 RepID=UPI0036AFD2EC
MSARPWGGADSRRSAAGPRTCERCGQPVLRQKDGLPWTVTVDEQRYTPDEAAKLASPNRLAWCLRESKWSGTRLVEVLPVFHNPACTWAHVIEHECPPEIAAHGRRPEGAMW